MTTVFTAMLATIAILFLAWLWSLVLDGIAHLTLRLVYGRRDRFRRVLQIARHARQRGIVMGTFEAQRQLRERAEMVERMFAQRELAGRN